MGSGDVPEKVFADVRVIGTSSEDEMIAVFLRGELESEREHGSALREALARSGTNSRIVTAPSTGDAAENALRRRLLDVYRGYERRVGLFDGFPRDVMWSRVELTKDELAAVRYINYSYWLALSGGSRDPADAAARIRSGFHVFGRMPTDGFLSIANAFAAGRSWSELIVVSALELGGDVVLEGHARLTAMALAWESVPEATTILRGVSPRVTKRSEYAVPKP